MNNMNVGPKTFVAPVQGGKSEGQGASFEPVTCGKWDVGLKGPYSKSNPRERDLGHRALGGNSPEDVPGQAAQQLELALRA
jgi:hypothetical protein